MTSKINYPQLPASSQMPRWRYVLARAVLISKLPAHYPQLPALYLTIYLKDCLTLVKECCTLAP
jgi:hypothetical protein